MTKNTINNFEKLIFKKSQQRTISLHFKKKEFWSKNFFVNRNTLIPRPETELLCENVIKIFKEKNLNILDMGTGTGCIILSIIK